MFTHKDFSGRKNGLRNKYKKMEEMAFPRVECRYIIVFGMV